MAQKNINDRLIQRLAEADDASRSERAARIMWLAPHVPTVSFIGDMVALQLMEEGRRCFVNGHFVSALLLATSFIEHTLAEELSTDRISKTQPGLAAMIKRAKELALFPASLLDRTSRLRELRNPFAHRRPPNDPNSLGNRFHALKSAPIEIMEADAQLAIATMYEYFHRTLKIDEKMETEIDMRTISPVNKAV